VRVRTALPSASVIYLLYLCAAETIRLAVLLPAAGSWPAGRASVGAIQLAVNEANDERAGKKISYSYKEIDCDQGEALASLFQLLEDGPVDAVIGPGSFRPLTEPCSRRAPHIRRQAANGSQCIMSDSNYLSACGGAADCSAACESTAFLAAGYLRPCRP
jgi:hypothetical protein